MSCHVFSMSESLFPPAGESNLFKKVTMGHLFSPSLHANWTYGTQQQRHLVAIWVPSDASHLVITFMFKNAKMKWCYMWYINMHINNVLDLLCEMEHSFKNRNGPFDKNLRQLKSSVLTHWRLAYKRSHRIEFLSHCLYFQSYMSKSEKITYKRQ